MQRGESAVAGIRRDGPVHSNLRPTAHRPIPRYNLPVHRGVTDSDLSSGEHVPEAEANCGHRVDLLRREVCTNVLARGECSEFCVNDGFSFQSEWNVGFELFFSC